MTNLLLAAILLLLVVLAMAALAIVGAITGAANKATGAANRVAGAAARLVALESCGWTVYLSRGCPACVTQMNLLQGTGFTKYVVYDKGVVTGGFTTTPPLQYNTIPAFPYWHNTCTGETREGVQTAASFAG